MLSVESFTAYYQLTKPGIIRANVLTGTAGFLFASRGNPNFVLLVLTLLGILLIIASACVLNNILDKHVDARMKRTKNRALVTGTISIPAASIFAGLLGTLGFLVLATQTNTLTVWVGVIAVIDYVLLYGFAKRRSMHGTLVGGIAGAAAIVAGYSAVTNQFDTAAFLLFAVMFVWQLPHFYAIALFRHKDYKNAGIPVVSVVKGKVFTQHLIVACIPLFALTSALLSFYEQTGATYLIAMMGLSAWWLWVGVSRYHKATPEMWGKAIFGSSLLVLLGFCLLISIDNFLP